MMTDLCKENALKLWKKERNQFSHKGDYGKVLIAGGSSGMTGASILCAKAAMHSGAGLVYIAMPERDLAIYSVAVPEAVKCPLKAEHSVFEQNALRGLSDSARGRNVIVLGPGMGRDENICSGLRNFLEGKNDYSLKPGDVKAVVLDADGLYAYGKGSGNLSEPGRIWGEKLIITPHEGEAARLLGTEPEYVSAHRAECVSELANMLSGGTAVLKGHETLVARFDPLSGKCEISVNHTGNAGMATGGSGDVLAGITAGLLATETASEYDSGKIYEIAGAAVTVHGICGDISREMYGERYFTAGNMIEALGKLEEYNG